MNQMSRRFSTGLLLAALAALGGGATRAATAADSAGPPREHFKNAGVLYDWVTNSRGDRLRTFITRPTGATGGSTGATASSTGKAGKVPVIFFVGWLSCDSVEYPQGETDGFASFIVRLIEQSGWATVRMDKPGVGESTGTRCERSDFQGEMEGYRAAFESMRKYDFIDVDRVFVVGMSNGGGVAPLAASPAARVRGYVAAGSWGRTWYEHMLDAERRRLADAGTKPGAITDAIRGYIDFYAEYLIRGKTPGEILSRHPEWKSLWSDAPDGQWGRPAAFYQQLQALNLARAWENAGAPVLVIRGRSEEIMSRADSEAIADHVNRVHPGWARYLEIDGMTHGFTVDGKFHAEIVPTVLGWMRDRLKAE